MALSAVTSHKLRSGLTLLGVLVGVFSIILVMTAMRAMQKNIEQNLGQLGSTSFAIQTMPGAFFGGPKEFMKYLRRKQISFAEAKRFQQRAVFVPYVALHATFWSGELTSRYAKTPPNVSIEGGTAALFQTNNWTITEGRGFLESDIDAARDVCVLSTTLAEALFPSGAAVGQRVKVAALSYTVIGVFERPTSAENAQSLAIIPISAGLNRYGRFRGVTILGHSGVPEQLEETMEQARGLFRTIRKVPPGEDDDFDVLSSDAMIAQFQKVTFAVRAGLTLVSSIALVAAGVGIMNIMLVSVTERTREIGIRRAIGARKRSIMMQFIMEAVVLCEIGGVLGVVLGMAGANALAIYVLQLPPAFPGDWALIALVICSLVGVIFGSYPAYKAANLDPIESLRYE
jgi:putative ABC transport system permease protein